MRSIHGLTGRVALAGSALALGLVACGDGGGGDRAETVSRPMEGTGDSTSTVPQEESSAESTGEVPRDRELDIELRHPDGITLQVSRIAFEGEDILVDLELVNNGSRDITVHIPGNEDVGTSMRLVDENEQTYHLLPPDERMINVSQGDTVRGTLQFLGPLIDEPNRLQLVINIPTEHIPAWELGENCAIGGCDSNPYDLYPTFVVPIDLVWG